MASEDQVELLPCPMCGGEAAHGSVRYCAATVKEQGWEQDEFYSVNCVRCCLCNRGLVGHRSPAAAAEKWNTRAALSAAQGWRPISEAPSPTPDNPKPGAIIVWSPMNGVTVREADGEWWGYEISRNPQTKAIPRYWQPLPPPPAEEA